jgi:hypothetical protein
MGRTLVIAACLAMAGCGGGATVTAPTPTPAAGGAVFPTLTDAQRQGLARYGLVRAAPAALREACDRVAGQTDRRVVCPTRVPGGRLSVVAVAGVAGRRTDFSAGYELSLDSGALRVPGAPDPGHWTFGAGTARAMRDQLTAYGRSAPLSRVRLKVGDVAVTRYREPDFGAFPGVYGGHVVYEWRQGDAVMQVSVHGARHERVLRGLVLLLSAVP